MGTSLLARFSSLVSALAALGALGCGPEFDPPTEIKSLRVLSVQKDKPYAAPGDDVKLTMLWHDGSPKADDTDRHVTISWFDACVNPPGDAYAGCYPQLAAKGACYEHALSTAGSAEPEDPEACGFHVGTGSEYTLHFASDGDPWLQGEPVLRPSQDPKLPHYGIAYMFFALCAGLPSIEETGVACRDPNDTSSDPRGRLLDSEDAVVGYTAIYAFAQTAQGAPRSEPYLNGNPVVTGFAVSGEYAADARCVGEDCLGSCDTGDCENHPPADIDCDADPKLCVHACPDDGDIQKCPPINIKPEVDEKLTVESDDVTNSTYGRSFQEQQWIDYYSTKGRFHSATKLLNDATRGYNLNYGTAFYAPKEAGPVQVWAVIHDNRGGQSWVGLTLQVQ